MGRIQHGRARNRGQRTHKTTIFGLMGGTIQAGRYSSSIRSAIYRATNYNQIPPKPEPGKAYMLSHNLLSRNPQCSGGVGRMHTHPGACGPCNCGLDNRLVSIQTSFDCDDNNLCDLITNIRYALDKYFGISQTLCLIGMKESALGDLHIELSNGQLDKWIHLYPGDQTFDQLSGNVQTWINKVNDCVPEQWKNDPKLGVHTLGTYKTGTTVYQSIPLELALHNAQPDPFGSLNGIDNMWSLGDGWCDLEVFAVAETTDDDTIWWDYGDSTAYLFKVAGASEDTYLYSGDLNDSTGIYDSMSLGSYAPWKHVLLQERVWNLSEFSHDSAGSLYTVFPDYNVGNRVGVFKPATMEALGITSDSTEDVLCYYYIIEIGDIVYILTYDRSESVYGLEPITDFADTPSVFLKEGDTITKSWGQGDTAFGNVGATVDLDDSSGLFDIECYLKVKDTLGAERYLAWYEWESASSHAYSGNMVWMCVLSDSTILDSTAYIKTKVNATLTDSTLLTVYKMMTEKWSSKTMTDSLCCDSLSLSPSVLLEPEDGTWNATWLDGYRYMTVTCDNHDAGWSSLCDGDSVLCDRGCTNNNPCSESRLGGRGYLLGTGRNNSIAYVNSLGRTEALNMYIQERYLDDNGNTQYKDNFALVEEYTGDDGVDSEGDSCVITGGVHLDTTDGRGENFFYYFYLEPTTDSGFEEPSGEVSLVEDTSYSIYLNVADSFVADSSSINKGYIIVNVFTNDSTTTPGYMEVGDYAYYTANITPLIPNKTDWTDDDDVASTYTYWPLPSSMKSSTVTDATGFPGGDGECFYITLSANTNYHLIIKPDSIASSIEFRYDEDIDLLTDGMLFYKGTNDDAITWVYRTYEDDTDPEWVSINDYGVSFQITVSSDGGGRVLTSVVNLLGDLKWSANTMDSTVRQFDLLLKYPAVYNSDLDMTYTVESDRIWAISSTGEKLWYYNLQQPPVGSVVLSPDKKLILTLGSTGFLIILCAKTGIFLSAIQLTGGSWNNGSNSYFRVKLVVGNDNSDGFWVIDTKFTLHHLIYNSAGINYKYKRDLLKDPLLGLFMEVNNITDPIVFTDIYGHCILAINIYHNYGTKVMGINGRTGTVIYVTQLTAPGRIVTDEPNWPDDSNVLNYMVDDGNVTSEALNGENIAVHVAGKPFGLSILTLENINFIVALTADFTITEDSDSKNNLFYDSSSLVYDENRPVVSGSYKKLHILHGTTGEYAMTTTNTSIPDSTTYSNGLWFNDPIGEEYSGVTGLNKVNYHYGTTLYCPALCNSLGNIIVFGTSLQEQGVAGYTYLELNGGTMYVFNCELTADSIVQININEDKNIRGTSYNYTSWVNLSGLGSQYNDGLDAPSTQPTCITVTDSTGTIIPLTYNDDSQKLEIDSTGKGTIGTEGLIIWKGQQSLYIQDINNIGDFFQQSFETILTDYSLANILYNYGVAIKGTNSGSTARLILTTNINIMAFEILSFEDSDDPVFVQIDNGGTPCQFGNQSRSTYHAGNTTDSDLIDSVELLNRSGNSTNIVGAVTIDYYGNPNIVDTDGNAQTLISELSSTPLNIYAEEFNTIVKALHYNTTETDNAYLINFLSTYQKTEGELDADSIAVLLTKTDIPIVSTIIKNNNYNFVLSRAGIMYVYRSDVDKIISPEGVGEIWEKINCICLAQNYGGYPGDTYSQPPAINGDNYMVIISDQGRYFCILLDEKEGTLNLSLQWDSWSLDHYINGPWSARVDSTTVFGSKIPQFTINITDIDFLDSPIVAGYTLNPDVASTGININSWLEEVSDDNRPMIGSPVISDKEECILPIGQNLVINRLRYNDNLAFSTNFLDADPSGDKLIGNFNLITGWMSQAAWEDSGAYPLHDEFNDSVAVYPIIFANDSTAFTATDFENYYFTSTPAVCSDHIWVTATSTASDPTLVFCLFYGTDNGCGLSWVTELASSGGVYSSVVVGNNYACVADNTYLYLLDKGDGSILQTAPHRQGDSTVILSTPVIVGDAIYLHVGTELLCYDISKSYNSTTPPSSNNGLDVSINDSGEVAISVDDSWTNSGYAPSTKFTIVVAPPLRRAKLMAIGAESDGVWTWTGEVATVVILDGGTGYQTGIYSLTFTSNDDVNGEVDMPVGKYWVSGGKVDSVAIESKGWGFTKPPCVSTTNSDNDIIPINTDAICATATAELNNDSELSVTVTNPGSGYTEAPVAYAKEIDEHSKTVATVVWTMNPRWSHTITSASTTIPLECTVYGNRLYIIGYNDGASTLYTFKVNHEPVLGFWQSKYYDCHNTAGKPLAISSEDHYTLLNIIQKNIEETIKIMISITNESDLIAINDTDSTVTNIAAAKIIGNGAHTNCILLMNRFINQCGSVTVLNTVKNISQQLVYALSLLNYYDVTDSTATYFGYNAICDIATIIISTTVTIWMGQSVVQLSANEPDDDGVYPIQAYGIAIETGTSSGGEDPAVTVRVKVLFGEFNNSDEGGPIWMLYVNPTLILDEDNFNGTISESFINTTYGWMVGDGDQEGLESISGGTDDDGAELGEGGYETIYFLYYALLLLLDLPNDLKSIGISSDKEGVYLNEHKRTTIGQQYKASHSALIALRNYNELTLRYNLDITIQQNSAGNYYLNESSYSLKDDAMFTSYLTQNRLLTSAKVCANKYVNANVTCSRILGPIIGMDDSSVLNTKFSTPIMEDQTQMTYYNADADGSDDHITSDIQTFVNQNYGYINYLGKQTVEQNPSGVGGRGYSLVDNLPQFKYQGSIIALRTVALGLDYDANATKLYIDAGGYGSGAGGQFSMSWRGIDSLSIVDAQTTNPQVGSGYIQTETTARVLSSTGYGASVYPQVGQVYIYLADSTGVEITTTGFRATPVFNESNELVSINMLNTGIDITDDMEIWCFTNWTDSTAGITGPMKVASLPESALTSPKSILYIGLDSVAKGSGYDEKYTTVSITDEDGEGSGAIAKPIIEGGTIRGITIIDPGYGYSDNTTATITTTQEDSTGFTEAIITDVKTLKNTISTLSQKVTATQNYMASIIQQEALSGCVTVAQVGWQNAYYDSGCVVSTGINTTMLDYMHIINNAKSLCEVTLLQQYLVTAQVSNDVISPAKPETYSLEYVAIINGGSLSTTGGTIEIIDTNSTSFGSVAGTYESNINSIDFVDNYVGTNLRTLSFEKLYGMKSTSRFIKGELQEITASNQGGFSSSTESGDVYNDDGDFYDIDQSATLDASDLITVTTDSTAYYLASVSKTVLADANITVDSWDSMTYNWAESTNDTSAPIIHCLYVDSTYSNLNSAFDLYNLETKYVAQISSFTDQICYKKQVAEENSEHAFIDADKCSLNGELCYLTRFIDIYQSNIDDADISDEIADEFAVLMEDIITLKTDIELIADIMDDEIATYISDYGKKRQTLKAKALRKIIRSKIGHIQQKVSEILVLTKQNLDSYTALCSSILTGDEIDNWEILFDYLNNAPIINEGSNNGCGLLLPLVSQLTGTSTPQLFANNSDGFASGCGTARMYSTNGLQCVDEGHPFANFNTLFPQKYGNTHIYSDKCSNVSWAPPHTDFQYQAGMGVRSNDPLRLWFSNRIGGWGLKIVESNIICYGGAPLVDTFTLAREDNKRNQEMYISSTRPLLIYNRNREIFEEAEFINFSDSAVISTDMIDILGWPCRKQHVSKWEPRNRALNVTIDATGVVSQSGIIDIRSHALLANEWTKWNDTAVWGVSLGQWLVPPCTRKRSATVCRPCGGGLGRSYLFMNLISSMITADYGIESGIPLGGDDPMQFWCTYTTYAPYLKFNMPNVALHERGSSAYMGIVAPKRPITELSSGGTHLSLQYFGLTEIIMPRENLGGDNWLSTSDIGFPDGPVLATMERKALRYKNFINRETNNYVWQLGSGINAATDICRPAYITDNILPYGFLQHEIAGNIDSVALAQTAIYSDSVAGGGEIAAVDRLIYSSDDRVNDVRVQHWSASHARSNVESSGLPGTGFHNEGPVSARKEYSVIDALTENWIFDLGNPERTKALWNYHYPPGNVNAEEMVGTEVPSYLDRGSTYGIQVKNEEYTQRYWRSTSGRPPWWKNLVEDETRPSGLGRWTYPGRGDASLLEPLLDPESKANDFLAESGLSDGGVANGLGVWDALDPEYRTWGGPYGVEGDTYESTIGNLPDGFYNDWMQGVLNSDPAAPIDTNAVACNKILAEVTRFRQRKMTIPGLKVYKRSAEDIAANIERDPDWTPQPTVETPDGETIIDWANCSEEQRAAAWRVFQIQEGDADEAFTYIEEALPLFGESTGPKDMGQAWQRVLAFETEKPSIIGDYFGSEGMLTAEQRVAMGDFSDAVTEAIARSTPRENASFGSGYVRGVGERGTMPARYGSQSGGAWNRWDYNEGGEAKEGWEDVGAGIKPANEPPSWSSSGRAIGGDASVADLGAGKGGGVPPTHKTLQTGGQAVLEKSADVVPNDGKELTQALQDLCTTRRVLTGGESACNFDDYPTTADFTNNEATDLGQAVFENEDWLTEGGVNQKWLSPSDAQTIARSATDRAAAVDRALDSYWAMRGKKDERQAIWSEAAGAKEAMSKPVTWADLIKEAEQGVAEATGEAIGEGLEMLGSVAESAEAAATSAYEFATTGPGQVFVDP